MITIRHTHEDGTTLDGSTKGDGVLELLDPYGFTWRRFSGVHISGSRDQFSWRYNLPAAADVLRAAGHEVELEVDDTWRPAAVRAADRGERVERRVERLDERAGLAAGRAAAAQASSDRISEGIPFGQPVQPVGHHSRGRHLRDLAKIDSGMRKAVDERAYAGHLAARADGSASNEAAKHDPRAIMRRIDTLKTHIRAAERGLDRATADLARTRWQAELDKDLEEVTYLEGILAEHAETGTFVAWSRDNIAKGDRVKVAGNWYPVTRINQKSVSLDSPSWPSKAKWDEIHGRRRDGEQLDTPNGEPWPEQDARGVAVWSTVASRVRAADRRYDDEGRRTVRNYEWALRMTLSLPLTAGDPEVRACLPAEDDTPAVRALALACLAVWKRLEAGHTVPDIAASTTPFATAPAWRIPADLEATDIRVDQLQPGDLVEGIWDRGFNDRHLIRGFAGPVAEVSDRIERRERGTWVKVTLAGGDSNEYQTHIWAAAYPAGTWEQPLVAGEDETAYGQVKSSDGVLIALVSHGDIS